MNCLTTRKIIQAQIANGGVSLADNALNEHIAGCEICRAYYEDSLLLTGLKNLTQPIMRAGFADQAIKQAIASNQGDSKLATTTVSLYRRIAAVVVVAFFVGLVVYNQNPIARDNSTAQPVAALNTATQHIKVVINSIADRANTTVTIELAENLELQGYPNRKTLSWTTDIRKGKNLLTLPVVLKNNDDSYLTLSYAYGPANKRIHIDVSHDKAGLNKQPTT